MIVLGFNVFFNLTAFHRLYVESVISQYRVIGKQIQHELENGLRFGKELNNFYGIEAILREGAESLGNQFGDYLKNRQAKRKDVSILIVSQDGKLIHHNPIAPEDWQFWKENGRALTNHAQDDQLKNQSNYRQHGRLHVTSLPIRRPHGEHAGFIFIALQSKGIDDFVSEIFSFSIRSTALISLCGLMALVLLLCRFLPADQDIFLYGKKRMTMITFAVVGTALAITCTISGFSYKNHYMEVNRKNACLMNDYLKRDTEYLMELGLRLEQIPGVDEYLVHFLEDFPQIESISLFDHTNQPVCRATREGGTDFQRSHNCYAEWVEATEAGTADEVSHMIRQKLYRKGTYKGYFLSTLSHETLIQKMFDIVLDASTVFIVSLLFFVEFLFMVFQFLKIQPHVPSISPAVNFQAIRPAAFLFLFGIDISVSFLPLYMDTLYEPFFALSKETVMGLPISIEFLFVGVSILLSGFWLDRRGWHEPFITGVLVAIFGTLYSWAAPDASNFILSRAIIGIGYGLALMASQGFVITHTDWKTKAQGLAHLFAGIYAGSICGTATGAMLSEWMGHRSVFLIGAAILCFVAVYVMAFMRTAMQKPAHPQNLPDKTFPKQTKIFQFLSNRSVLALIFFSSLPAAITVIGFVNYFSPIYLNRIGASQSTIGQILMLYGICLIYCGPFFSKYVDSSPNKKKYILLGCFLGSAALLSFGFLRGVFAAVIAVVLLGISSSFVLASQSVYALHLKVTRELGEGKAIGIFRSTSRLGQMLGPIVFSAAIAGAGINTGISLLGAAYFMTALLFLIVTDRKSVV